MSTKEGELMVAGLVYLSRCLAEGDLHAIRTMGLTRGDIAALRELRLTEVLRLAQEERRGSFLEIRLDRYAFWRHLEYLEAQRRSEETILALIQADAPREMLAALFGLSSQGYRSYRMLLGLAPKVGRPQEPDEATVQAVWSAWRKVTTEVPAEEIGAGHYLEVHRATGVPLRVIWGLVQPWLRGNKNGRLTNASADS